MFCGINYEQQRVILKKELKANIYSLKSTASNAVRKFPWQWSQSCTEVFTIEKQASHPTWNRALRSTSKTEQINSAAKPPIYLVGRGKMLKIAMRIKVGSCSCSCSVMHHALLKIRLPQSNIRTSFPHHAPFDGNLGELQLKKRTN